MTLYWPDISSYQAGIDLAGALVVVAKATEGTGYVNPDYGQFRAEAARHGTYFAAYHFLSAGNAGAQAAHAHQVVGSAPLMLDFEPSGTAPSLTDAITFIDGYRRTGGTCWLVYLPHWYWQQLGSPPLKPLHDRGMLLVSSAYGPYTDADWGQGWQPYGGMAPTVWQYSSSVPFNRQLVDFNAFRGRHAGKQDPASVAACLAEFKSLATTGKYPAATAPAPAPVAETYRHAVPAGNTASLDTVARQRHTTVTAIATYSLLHLNTDNAAILNAYTALRTALMKQGQPPPPMPAGLIYWTRNP